MDVATLSVSLKQASLAQQVNISVLKKAMDSSGSKSEALVKMMERSITPNLGNSIDVRI